MFGIKAAGACAFALGVSMLAGFGPIAAHAQGSGGTAYPTKLVKIIVPYAPGTAPDVIARITGEGLAKRLGQSFVVENRTGAGGKIGTEAAATAPADGYTLFLGSKDTQSVMAHLYPSWSIKPSKDLVPVLGIANIQNVLVTRASSPISNIKEAIAASKVKQLTYGSPGVGTNLHLMGVLLSSRYGMNLLHVPYSRNFGEALPAAIRGDLDFVIAGLPPSLGMLRDGRIKAIAITGTARSSFAPQVPTFAEQGIEGLEVGGWFGLFAPAATPQPILARLTAEMTEVLKDPDTRAHLEKMSADIAPTSPDKLNAQIKAESERWGKIISEAGIHVE